MYRGKRSGQSLVEYGLVISLMAVIVLASVNSMGTKVSAAGAVAGNNVAATAVNSSTTKSISDIMSGNASSPSVSEVSTYTVPEGDSLEITEVASFVSEDPDQEEVVIDEEEHSAVWESAESGEDDSVTTTGTWNPASEELEDELEMEQVVVVAEESESNAEESHPFF